MKVAKRTLFSRCFRWYNSWGMRRKSLWFTLGGLGVAVFAACSPDPPIISASDVYVPYGLSSRNAYTGIHDRAKKNWSEDYGKPSSRTVSINKTGFGSLIKLTRKSGPSKSASQILKEVNVRKDFLSYSARGRTRKKMSPKYITIHSTQNWSPGADANRHALALKRGALGRLSWHYTTDENRAVQHLPTNEQGNHADYGGPGNRYSIGIEMCEHPGNSRTRTVDRTAKLAAYLCVKYGLPVSKVVPHYKWPRWGKNPPNKNCPHFLLNNGRPGREWQKFLSKVESYHRQIR